MQFDEFHAFVSNAKATDPQPQSGPLAGATLAVKDIFDVEGYPTGCGNPHKLTEARPATATAPAVQSLLDAGARFIGKTQTDEFAFSLTGHNAHYAQPINPRAPDRVTGGSSSGSVAAVAAGLADIATGSDTGGSIRAPASYCGLIGLRTTHGRIRLDGTMPLAPSFDTFGWFARDGALYEKVAEVLLGEDENNAPLIRVLRLPHLEAQVDDKATEEYGENALIIETVLGNASGFELQNHSIEDLYWCFRHLQAEEAWQSHRNWLTAGNRDLGPGVRERFEFGSGISAETVELETKRRDGFRADLAAALGNESCIIMPTVPGAAPLRADSFESQQDYRERALRLLCLSGLSGFPQITLPLGQVDGAPFGISILGPQGCDRALISLGRRILKAAGKDA